MYIDNINHYSFTSVMYIDNTNHSRKEAVLCLPFQALLWMPWRANGLVVTTDSWHPYAHLLQQLTGSGYVTSNNAYDQLYSITKAVKMRAMPSSLNSPPLLANSYKIEMEQSWFITFWGG